MDLNVYMTPKKGFIVVAFNIDRTFFKNFFFNLSGNSLFEFSDNGL